MKARDDASKMTSVRPDRTSEQSERDERGTVPHVFVEPWPVGGWAIWVEGHPAPVARCDTEDEAEFRAAAYRRGIVRGHQLAFSEAGGVQQQRLDGEDEQLIDLVREVLVDPNLHTDLRMRLQEEIAEILHVTHQGLSPTPRAEPTRPPAHAQAEYLPSMLNAALVDPNLHTDERMRLHREIRELVKRVG